VLACASVGGRDDLEVDLESDMNDPSERAWAIYGEALRAAIEARPATAHNQSLDDYPIELAARGALARHWEATRTADSASDAYLDVLVAVYQAGHLEEYVLAVFGRPGWTVPADALDAIDFPPFLDYARANLREHRIETRAGVRGAGIPEFPDEPGATLPELELMAADGTLCGQLAEAQQALTRWVAEASQLDGVALAAADPAEFAESLAQARELPAARARGVTWVSPLAASISFHVGFCEIDRKNYAASIRPLQTAVDLYPRFPLWRLELAKAFTIEKRFDDAEREIATAIASTRDACVLGGAWRSRGYLLIDRGQLREAYEAYITSLEYDPRSRLAIAEIELIRKELARESDDASLPDYVPPAMGEQQIMECPSS